MNTRTCLYFGLKVRGENFSFRFLIDLFESCDFVDVNSWMILMTQYYYDSSSDHVYSPSFVMPSSDQLLLSTLLFSWWIPLCRFPHVPIKILNLYWRRTQTTKKVNPPQWDERNDVSVTSAALPVLTIIHKTMVYHKFL